jgi:hypothetical protein
MSMRGLGAVLVLALVGLVGGFAVGHVVRAEPVTLSGASPVPARNPSIPVDRVRPYAHDISYPGLQAGLSYRRHTIGPPSFRWAYDVPRGWQPFAFEETLDEVRWRPRGEPEVGGFSLRVKLSTEHKTKESMVAQKLSAMEAGYDDVEVLGRTGDLLSFSYREPAGNVKRYNTFRWFSLPGQSEAKFEMSVVGREVDRPGLDDLLARVSGSIRKLP